MREYRDHTLQKKITSLPDPGDMYFNELRRRGPGGMQNGAYTITKAKNNNDRNNTWQSNHRLIIEYIERAVQGLGRLPTGQEIARELKISRGTVSNHLRSWKNNPANELEQAMMRLLAEKIMLSAFKDASEFGASMKDKKDAIACYKMLSPGVSPDIVINNFRFDINVINNLPEDKKNKIFRIITKK